MTNGVDTTDRGLTGAMLKASGYQFACRYVANAPGPNHTDKELTAAEIREKSAAGVRLVSNFEWTPVPTNTVAEGKAHARAFLDSAAGTLGPEWHPCYYSVDTAAGAGAYDNYAHGWADILTPERCGVYGDGELYRALKAAGLVHYAWQSMSSSFPGNSNTSGADIIQTGNGHIGAHSVDFNTAPSANYGGWLLGEEDPMVLTDADAQLVVDKLLADPAMADLLWRVYAMANMNDTFANGSMKGAPVAFTKAIKAIPLTASPASPADSEAVADAVVDELAGRLES